VLTSQYHLPLPLAFLKLAACLKQLCMLLAVLASHSDPCLPAMSMWRLLLQPAMLQQHKATTLCTPNHSMHQCHTVAECDTLHMSIFVCTLRCQKTTQE
jgi:hypothetical protein